MSGRRTNWAGNITFRAEAVHSPASLAQLQSLVAGSRRVRALGSGHSFNDIADSPGVLVSLADLPFTAELDSDAARVRVNAGVRYGQLGRYLHRKGFALRNLGSLPHISVAGSCATATHGSGDGNGNLATAVSELEMVTAGGDVVVLGRDDDRFPGAVVGLGALGVVVNLTLDLVPSFAVRQYVYEGLALDVVGDHFADIVSSAYSVSLFTDWRTPRFGQVWVKQRVPEDETRRVDGLGRTGPEHVREREQEPESPWFGATLADGPRHPVQGASPVGCTTQLGVPGPWLERLPHFRPDFTPSVGAELQSEYLVPRRYAVEALRALDRVRARIHPVLQVSEVRTVAADDLWLSPCYRRDAVAVHFTWVDDLAAVRPVMTLVEEQLAPFEARPHWGKLFTTPPDALRSRYERLPDFRALMRHFDPAGTFANPFTARYLTGGDGHPGGAGVS